MFDMIEKIVDQEFEKAKGVILTRIKGTMAAEERPVMSRDEKYLKAILEEAANAKRLYGDIDAKYCAFLMALHPKTVERYAKKHNLVFMDIGKRYSESTFSRHWRAARRVVRLREEKVGLWEGKVKGSAPIWLLRATYYYAPKQLLTRDISEDWNRYA